MPDDSTIPANTLAKHRKARSWAQADVGHYLHLTAVSVCRHETLIVRVGPRNRHAYATLYGVSIEALFPPTSDA
jgi:hypothetical protein